MPRHSFLLRPQRPYPILLIGPKTYQLRIELINLATAVVIFGLPVLVFQLAGGDWSDVDAWLTRLANVGWTALPTPMVAAAVTFLGLVLASSMSEHQAKLRETRAAGLWIARMHPEDLPRPAVAELVKEILRTDGPLHPVEIRRRVTEGGPWGEPTPLSAIGMAALLTPGGRTAPWLRPRSPGEPFSVPERPYVPAPAGTPAV